MTQMPPNGQDQRRRDVLLWLRLEAICNRLPCAAGERLLWHSESRYAHSGTGMGNAHIPRYSTKNKFENKVDVDLQLDETAHQMSAVVVIGTPAVLPTRWLGDHSPGVRGQTPST